MTKLKYVSTIAVLLFSFSSYSAPVWKIEKNGNQLFIGGTVHHLSESEYPLAEEFQTAYLDSDTVYFESDIAGLQSREVVNSILEKMTYKNGQTIADVLQDSTLVQLKSSLKNMGLPYEQLAHLKPSLMGQTLSSFELKRLGLDGKGVDKYFHDLASTEGKKIGWLESTEVQVSTLAAFGEGQEDEYMRYTLDKLSDHQNTVNEMIRDWKQADVDALDHNHLTPMKNNFPDVYQKVVVDRNEAWLPKIESMLNNEETEFVLIGILHLAGQDSLMKKLTDKGYSISKL